MLDRNIGTLGRDSSLKVRMLSCRGVSEGRWEGTREAWYGDMDRDRSGSMRKRARRDEGSGSIEPRQSEGSQSMMGEA